MSRTTILLLVTDLMFHSRIEAAAAGLAIDVKTPPNDEAALGAIATGPNAVVIDLHDTAFDAQRLIAQASAAGVPILAFGRHTEPQTLRGAREAGAGLVVPRSQLVDELPSLLERLVASSTAPADSP
ncbi:MAG TPA: hypothetical protein VIH21_09500 [Dehalococcoidia bacterium]